MNTEHYKATATAPTIGHAGYSENFDASKAWKAYNEGCTHRDSQFAGEHIGASAQWDKWSADERKAYLRGYNGQFINSEAYKGNAQ